MLEILMMIIIPILYFLTSLPADMKLEQACLNLPVMRGGRSSSHPCCPYLTTVVQVRRPPVTTTVSVTGSGMAQAWL